MTWLITWADSGDYASCGYSEAPHQPISLIIHLGTSNEYLKTSVLWRNLQNYLLSLTLPTINMLLGQMFDYSSTSILDAREELSNKISQVCHIRVGHRLKAKQQPHVIPTLMHHSFCRLLENLHNGSDQLCHSFSQISTFISLTVQQKYKTGFLATQLICCVYSLEQKDSNG